MYVFVVVYNLLSGINIIYFLLIRFSWYVWFDFVIFSVNFLSVFGLLFCLYV